MILRIQFGEHFHIFFADEQCLVKTLGLIVHQCQADLQLPEFKASLPFFIIGAYLALYFGLSTVAIAVMAGAVGFVYIGLDKRGETMMEEVN